MNDLARQTLSRIIAEHGREICDSPKRVEALLRDLCGAYRREINIIVGALEERVAKDLIAAGNSVPRDVLLARLAARLRDNLAYTPEAANWGVETWAVALGILTEAELQERARKESAELSQSTSPSAESAPQASASTSADISRPTPKQHLIITPSLKPPTSPPVIQVPTSGNNSAIPSPAQILLLHNVARASATTSRRGRTMRGCLVAVMLVIALIVIGVFVVPPIIMLLQDEQAQPSINEPRIK